MTMAFTVSKSKEFVILTSLGKAKNLPTVNSYSLPLSLTTAQPDDRFWITSFLVVQNDSGFNSLQTKKDRHSSEP